MSVAFALMFNGMDGIWSATDENYAIDNHGEKLSVILFVVVYFLSCRVLEAKECNTAVR